MTTQINNNSPDNSIEQNQSSFRRWWRQVCFVPILHGNWHTPQLSEALSNKVTQAEQGHNGEVVFIIENHLPIATAFRQDCRSRAVELFSDYGVWDTEDNSGVLVYLNVCEHSLQIVADRGIDARVADDTWQSLCDKALSGLAQAKIESSLSTLLDEIGEVLRKYSTNQDHNHDEHGNELCDKVVKL